jgi:hypothetical protein
LRRNLCAADELCEVIDRGQSEIVGGILGVGGDLANRGGVLCTQTIRDTHFVQVRISGQRKETAVLIFPAKTAGRRGFAQAPRERELR